MARISAVYDACVLYPAPLRDLLMQLALLDLFRAHWTKDIHAEWMRNVLENRPDLTHQQLERTRDLMDMHVRDCLVEGYEDIIPTVELPDPADRHVLAAAVVAGADVIVTYNLKDFPQPQLTPYGIQVQHPDEFITHFINRVPADVWGAVAAVRARLRNPPRTVDEYLEILEHQRLPMTVTALRPYAHLL